MNSMEKTRAFLESIGLPGGDAYSLPTSEKRFPDGGQYRFEVPGIQGPKAMEAGFSLKELTEMADVTLPKAASYRVRNIWERTEFIAKDRIAQSVEPHSVILYRIKEKQS